MNDRIEQLSKVQLFAGLKPHALELIAKVASEETHAAGTKIFQHGDAGDKLYLILEGRVRISREVPGMGEEALAVLGPGQIFGEMALLDESPRSADARVHERCRLLAIAKDGFDDLEDVTIRVAEEEPREGRRPLRLDQLRAAGPQPGLQPIELLARKSDGDVTAELRLERGRREISHLDQMQFLLRRDPQPSGGTPDVVGPRDGLPAQRFGEKRRGRGNVPCRQRQVGQGHR